MVRQIFSFMKKTNASNTVVDKTDYSIKSRKSFPANARGRITNDLDVKYPRTFRCELWTSDGRGRLIPKHTWPPITCSTSAREQRVFIIHHSNRKNQTKKKQSQRSEKCHLHLTIYENVNLVSKCSSCGRFTHLKITTMFPSWSVFPVDRYIDLIVCVCVCWVLCSHLFCCLRTFQVGYATPSKLVVPAGTT